MRGLMQAYQRYGCCPFGQFCKTFIGIRIEQLFVSQKITPVQAHFNHITNKMMNLVHKRSQPMQFKKFKSKYLF